MSSDTATVRERPILFSGPMVKAILEGRKTETRRIIKPQPYWMPGRPDWQPPNPDQWGWDPNQDHHHIWRADEDPNQGDWGPWMRSMCLFGQPGDRLWVRETARLSSMSGYGGEITHVRLEYRVPDRDHVRVREFKQPDPGHYDFDRWTPSIHMPRWASRLTLEITAIRVERLQEISLDSVIAEGIEPVQDGPHANQYWREETGAKFIDLWDKINGQRSGCSWEANPFVWVIGFRRIDPAPQQKANQ
jgi:hypothetical protein